MLHCDMPGHVSRRHFAKEIGRDPRTVRKAMARGCIAAESDGCLDLRRCREDWSRNVDPVQGWLADARAGWEPSAPLFPDPAPELLRRAAAGKLTHDDLDAAGLAPYDESQAAAFYEETRRLEPLDLCHLLVALAEDSELADMREQGNAVLGRIFTAIGDQLGGALPRMARRDDSQPSSKGRLRRR